MKKIILKGRGLIEGITEGEALVSDESLVWSHGIVPETGEIDDVRVKVCGENVSGKILVYPLGKGSTTGATWMLETTRCKNAPKAIINRESELIILAGSILSKTLYDVTIPIIDKVEEDPCEIISTGDWVKVDGTNGIIEITKK